MIEDKWMQTYRGKKVHPFNFKLEDCDLTDIGHSLSMICRFNGHCTRFYSVAEHSVRVSDMLPDKLKLQGLLHDAAEAYLGDVIWAYKDSTQLLGQKFKYWEDKISAVIAERYDLPWPFDPVVKHADLVLLATEARDIMNCKSKWKRELPEPLPGVIRPMPSNKACVEFMTAVTAERISLYRGKRCDFYGNTNTQEE